MRKLIATLCITAILASVVGCGGSDTKKDDKKGTTPPPADAPK